MDIFLELIRSFVAPIPIEDPLALLYVVGNFIMQMYAWIVSGGDISSMGGGGFF